MASMTVQWKLNDCSSTGGITTLENTLTCSFQEVNMVDVLKHKKQREIVLKYNKIQIQIQI